MRSVDINKDDKYNDWTIEEVIRTKGKNTICVCRCKCDTVKPVLLCNLRTGKSKNCGCVRNAATAERNYHHGGRQDRLYRIWAAMKSRCSNPNTLSFKHYGGRGD